jgi:hypothetical protein
LDEIQVKNNQIKKKNPFKSVSSVQSVFHFWNLTALGCYGVFLFKI